MPSVPLACTSISNGRYMRELSAKEIAKEFIQISPGLGAEARVGVGKQ